MVLYARDIVEKDFLSLPQETTVLEAAKAMKGSKHGFVVIGVPTQPQGLITEWDILSKVVAEGRDPGKVTLSEIMSSEIIAVQAGEGIETVSRLMNEKGIRRLLVKDGDVVVGFITSKTLLARLNEYVDRVSAQISRLQTPWF